MSLKDLIVVVNHPIELVRSFVPTLRFEALLAVARLERRSRPKS